VLINAVIVSVPKTSNKNAVVRALQLARGASKCTVANWPQPRRGRTFWEPRFIDGIRDTGHRGQINGSGTCHVIAPGSTHLEEIDHASPYNVLYTFILLMLSFFATCDRT